MIQPPFDRTVCGCSSCVDCCREQPGNLIPGDLERIAAYLGLTMPEAENYFWNSPGALVLDAQTGQPRRIRTITPKFIERKGACVFLTPDGKCRIHEVSPFGCAYFDVHMGQRIGSLKSLWGIRLIDADKEYHRTRISLMVATHYKGQKV